MTLCCRFAPLVLCCANAPFELTAQPRNQSPGWPCSRSFFLHPIYYYYILFYSLPPITLLLPSVSTIWCLYGMDSGLLTAASSYCLHLDPRPSVTSTRSFRLRPPFRPRLCLLLLLPSPSWPSHPTAPCPWPTWAVAATTRQECPSRLLPSGEKTTLYDRDWQPASGQIPPSFARILLLRFAPVLLRSFSLVCRPAFAPCILQLRLGLHLRLACFCITMLRFPMVARGAWPCSYMPSECASVRVCARFDSRLFLFFFFPRRSLRRVGSKMLGNSSTRTLASRSTCIRFRFAGFLFCLSGWLRWHGAIDRLR